MLPSTISLVVPDILVTIALSFSKNVFKRDDLPTFGRPIIAMFIPFFINSPFLYSLSIFCKVFWILVNVGVIFSLVITNSSVYSG